MTRIIVGADVSAQLHNLHTPAEVCDESGRTLGRFVPPIDLSQYDLVLPEPTEEELDRIADLDEPGYTLAEALAHLEKQ
jgi:hypothetical protein